jgi:FixJ family two-component response regulator
MENRPFVVALDDDSFTCFFLERTLRSGQIDCRTFCDANEFLDFLKTNTCDCILMDYNMPVLSGTEVQCRLSEMGVTTPLIMVTASADMPTAMGAFNNGAVNFITKPFAPVDLLNAIRAALDEPRASAA